MVCKTCCTAPPVRESKANPETMHSHPAANCCGLQRAAQCASPSKAGKTHTHTHTSVELHSARHPEKRLKHTQHLKMLMPLTRKICCQGLFSRATVRARAAPLLWLKPAAARPKPATSSGPGVCKYEHTCVCVCLYT